MDVIDVIKSDKAYLKCKVIVKNWEKNFIVKHSRTPSKFDIKEAPSKIKYAYKKYFQMKSAALDNSLSVFDFEDSICSPEPIPSLTPDPVSPDSKQLLQTLPSGQELQHILSVPLKELNTSKDENEEPTEEIKANTDKKEVKTLCSFSNNLSKKLFQTRKFSMRNPRKFAFQKSQQLQDLNIDDNNMSDNGYNKEMNDNNSITNNQSEINSNSFENADPLDCFSTTSNRSMNISTSISLYDNVKQNKTRHINEAWLKRVSSFIDEAKTTCNETFGSSRQQSNDNNTTHDYVENSESDDDQVMAKLMPALKKRKISDFTRSISLNEENDKHTMNITVDSTKLIENVKLNKRKTKPIKNRHLTKENDVDKKLPDISEFLPFGIEKDVIPRHTDISAVLQDVDNSKKSETKTEITKMTTATDRLEKKIRDGTLNENFVKINIEKKVFVRGKKNINYSKYKKKLWKDKKALHGGMEFPESGKICCFKCGLSGHMARYCTAHRGDTLLPLDDCDGDMPTLEEMENIVLTSHSNQSNTQEIIKSIYKASPIPQDFLKTLAQTPFGDNDNISIKPIYSDDITQTPEDVLHVLKMFGHNSFRPGQEQAIMRILRGMSTLLVLSTGGGKSLCYQIPAYLYSQHFKCITLVISPLVSLMEDQVLSMPDFLKAGCLHTNQSPTQRQKILQIIKDGELNILLISPEALISGEASNGFGGLFKTLPPIAFACIDEAHCVSQWSHNFRPSYLMICKVLREKLNVKCILGLTATASQSTIKSVINHVNIHDDFQGVISNPTLPDNLFLSVSFEKDKDKALISLITSDTLNSYNSIIVYCIRRDECERVAAILRSSLQQPGKINMESKTNKRKRMSYIAEAYHAGMSAAQRKKIQRHFMDGVVRIIVATVAFGMGINKSDIRCIIHYNMPSSFESYVQEVGRAGRDGKQAHCHVLMNNSSNDKSELLKHIHADTMDRPTIRKLIQKIFITCECYKNQTKTDDNISLTRCKGHEVGIPMDQTVEELDVASENIATLLCYLELHPQKYIKVLNNSYTVCKIMSYGGPRKILEAAKSCPPLAMAYILESKKNPDITKNNILQFQVIEVAAAIGWDSGMAKYQLKNLEWLTEGGITKRSQLKVEFNTLGFRIKAPGDLSTTELDKMLDDLYEDVMKQEKVKLYQLEEIHKTFKKLGDYSLEHKELLHESQDLSEKSKELKQIIRNYFIRNENMDDEIKLEQRPVDEERVASDVRSLIVSYKDCNFTGRSIAKIFQGISSPNYPAIVWGRCKFWRSHIHEGFYDLIRIATQQIIQMKLSH